MSKRKKRGGSSKRPKVSKRSTSKKGAIELSMTTIIVIVVGVVMLTLGLTWVKSIFSRVGDTTTRVFDLSDTTISDLFQTSDKLLGISPDEIDLPQGDSRTVDIVMANLEKGEITVKATVEPLNSQDLNCYFAETGSDASKTHTVTSGSAAAVAMIVESKGDLGIYSCYVEVLGGPSGYSNSGTLIVKVENN